jgi:hypothetical protein
MQEAGTSGTLPDERKRSEGFFEVRAGSEAWESFFKDLVKKRNLLPGSTYGSKVRAPCHLLDTRPLVSVPVCGPSIHSST